MNLNQKKLPVLVICIAVAVSFLVVMAIAGWSGKDDSMRLENAEKRYIDTGASCLEGGVRKEIRSYPYRSEGKEGYFYLQLPEDIIDGTVLVLPNGYQKIEVSLNGKPLYEYGMYNASPYYMEARINCDIRLPAGSGGQELEIHLINTEKAGNAVLQQGYLTTAGEMTDGILADNLWALLFCVMSAISGICILAMSLWQHVKKAEDSPMIFFFLGLFALLSSAWVFTDSGLPQLIFDDSQMLMVLSFELFMLMPVPLLLFVQLVCEYSRKVFGILVTGYIANFLVQNVAYAVKISDFKHMVYLTHILIIVSIIAIAYYIMRGAVNRHSLYARWTLGGVGIFAGFSSLSLLSFYETGGNQNEKFFIIGFFIFLSILIMLAIHKFQEVSEESARSEVLQGLAYKDMMTGLGNRTLYEEHITSFEAGRSAEITGVIALDINNLKEVNDRFGHRTGDELLKLAARCLREAFGNRGMYYRIGGDEFVIILKGAYIGEDECRRLLGSCIKKHNDSLDIKLSVSMGYAAPDRETGTAAIRELIEKADARMYEEKKRFHNGR
ncbi:GGDEF domain-containing protein [Dorea sp. D27]|uniref:GGDEF domain-containing protein n=1 Tax=Dorea sp. D27 TaxID=658665 RepID=UPI0006738C2F|nr:GGDEF domain-containing protein [Dorea sp. D27]KMZ53375.1 sensory box/response regulator [Dorea sp. D27]